MIPVQHTINTPYVIGQVHCYTAELGGELVLFDTGPATLEAQQYLQKNIDLRRLKHVVITHCHIDHYGQAAWLGRNSDAVIYLPEKDCLKINGHAGRMEQMFQLLIELGFGREYLSQLRKIFDSGAIFPPFPEDYLTTETDLPDYLGIEVVGCPGHSQSDLVFTGDDWAITGDTLLRGVFQSPVLDLDMEVGGRFNNYKAYCRTLQKLASLRSRTVLPGHRQSIKSVDTTLLFYISKMLSRASQLHPYRGEENLFLIIENLFGERAPDVFHIYLKFSELLFLKDFLKEPGLLRDSLETIGLFEEVSPLYYQAVGDEVISSTMQSLSSREKQINDRI
ncbi:MAG: MBL fold metallo-hydrolase [Deltaproteobacteria bacterium]|nr:MBL fold metallo-hydrolase [Deltaproteobacteria bacterium]MBW2658047.1 MBL fold metallo-hydrolase [Deltaproteobacteria bacterium]